MTTLWWAFWIRVYFFGGALGVNLRRIVNGLQRLLNREPWWPRAPLPLFATPGDVEDYIRGRFAWRKDGTRLGGLFLPLDYVTHPEVFQAQLETEGGVDGDCDDHHFWVATVLQTVPGVAWAHTLSCVWKGGGHTTCLYEHNGVIRLFNYRIGPAIVGTITKKQAAAAAALDVLAWANAKHAEDEPDVTKLTFWVLETTGQRLVATG